MKGELRVIGKDGRYVTWCIEVKCYHYAKKAPFVCRVSGLEIRPTGSWRTRSGARRAAKRTAAREEITLVTAKDAAG